MVRRYYGDLNVDLKRGGRIALAIAVVVAASVYLVLTVDLLIVVEIVLDASMLLYLVGVASFFLTVPLRAKRWGVLLRGIGSETSVRWLNGVVFLSLYLNTVLPAKSGDIYRGYRVSDRCSKPMSSVLATIFVERVFDLVILVGLLAVISLGLVQQVLYDSTRVLVAGAAIAGVALVLLYLLEVRPEWIYRQIGAFRRGLQCIESAQTFGVFILLTTTVWGLNVVRIFALAGAIEVSLGTRGVVLVAVVVTILTGLPITPGGVGIVESVTTATLIGIGISESAGLALVLLDRSITIVLVVITGSLYLSYRAETIDLRAMYHESGSEDPARQE